MGLVSKSAHCVLAAIIGILMSRPIPLALGAKPQQRSVSSFFDTSQKYVDELYRSRFENRKSPQAKKLVLSWKDFEHGRYTQARARLSGLKKDPLFLDAALILEGRTYLSEGLKDLGAKRNKQALEKGGLALDAFVRLLLEKPGSSLVSEGERLWVGSEVLMGDAAFQLKRKDEALKYYERAFQRCPSNRMLTSFPLRSIENFTSSCLKHSSDLCVARVQRLAQLYPSASKEYKVLVTAFPDAGRLARMDTGSSEQRFLNYRAPDRDIQAVDEALALLLKGENSDAKDALKKALVDFPRTSQIYRVKYWLARLAEKDSVEALTLYNEILADSPLSYYGMLASLATSKRPEALIGANLPKAAEADPSLLPQELQGLERAHHLLSEGGDPQARDELAAISPRSQFGSPFLMYLASLQFDVGNYLRTFQFLDELFKRGYEGVTSTYSLRLIFPLAYQDLISRSARDLKVDPYLVLSLIKQESAFNPGAVSSSGAAGLMQLMPTTAVETDSTLTLYELPDQAVNIRVGTKYLSEMLERFGGNIVLALAAYNAGPHRAAKWKEVADPKWGMLEFIESIPYLETRGYVSSIVRNYFWYASRIAGRNLESLSYFWEPGTSPGFELELPRANEKSTKKLTRLSGFVETN